MFCYCESANFTIFGIKTSLFVFRLINKSKSQKQKTHDLNKNELSNHNIDIYTTNKHNLSQVCAYTHAFTYIHSFIRLYLFIYFNRIWNCLNCNVYFNTLHYTLLHTHIWSVMQRLHMYLSIAHIYNIWSIVVCIYANACICMGGGVSASRE